MSHHCHAYGCSVPTKPALFMCMPHWRMVPEDLKKTLCAAYRHGQTKDKKPSREWIDAAIAVRRAVGLVRLERP